MTPSPGCYGTLRVPDGWDTDSDRSRRMRGPADVPPGAMITAVDSSVLLDVLTADPTHGEASATALRHAARPRCPAGVRPSCGPKWRRGTDRRRGCMLTWTSWAISYSPTSIDAAALAGSTWARYRQAGGPRTRIVADFLIGAHAATEADGLLDARSRVPSPLLLRSDGHRTRSQAR